MLKDNQCQNQDYLNRLEYKERITSISIRYSLLDENDQEIDERNIEDEERRFPRSIEKEDVNEEKEVVTDAMKSEELVETEESESL